MSVASNDQLALLRDAITNKPPYCSGVYSPTADEFGLFFKKGKTSLASWIDLCNASQPDLEMLSDACQPATFGLGQQDVRDESYRKALKLDTSDFSTKFSLERSGLLNIIRSELLEGHDDKKEIEGELYKLNVYGKDSFFKAHKDTPRGNSMFGSLVVSFPTPHEGGVFVLRHMGEEWTFDSSKALSDQRSPSIAYIAFYSDVEHEVLTVTSGYRVTLTFNLYFSEKRAITKIDATRLSNEVTFRSALSSLLHDAKFLPQGGMLGFGLQHQYPLSKKGSLAALVKCLKGSDAVIRRVCRDLSLDATLQFLYTEGPGKQVIVGEIIDMDGSGEVDTSRTEMLCQYFGGTLLKSDHSTTELDSDEEDADFEKISWVTPVTRFSRLETPFVAYGNEASLEYLYGDLVLVVSVGEYGKRATL